jgi:alpha,alpha-trehalase
MTSTSTGYSRGVMAAVLISPDRHRAVIFDLDGVVTDTARVHFRAWSHLFDEFLDQREPRPGEDLQAFSKDDYLQHVDGKARRDGVTSFLASRGIELPEGNEDDPDDRCTVHGLGNRKNRLVRQRLEADGVDVFESTVDLVRELQRAGIGTAVISASRNCRLMLESAGPGRTSIASDTHSPSTTARSPTHGSTRSSRPLARSRAPTGCG